MPQSRREANPGRRAAKRWKSAARRPYDRTPTNENIRGETTWRGRLRFSAHPTPASRRSSTGCAALEGQPQPPAAPGELRVVRLHPSRRGLAGDRHPGLDRAPARRHRRAARRRRRGDLRRPRPGGGGARLALPARGRGRRHPGRPLHQPHRRGDRPGPRHRRGAAGLRRASDRPAPDPDPRRRPGHRRRRPRLRARLGLPRGRAVAARRDPRRARSTASTRRAASCSSTCPSSTTTCSRSSSRTASRRATRSTRSAPACSARTARSRR